MLVVVRRKNSVRTRMAGIFSVFVPQPAQGSHFDDLVHVRVQTIEESRLVGTLGQENPYKVRDLCATENDARVFGRLSWKPSGRRGTRRGISGSPSTAGRWASWCGGRGKSRWLVAWGARRLRRQRTIVGRAWEHRPPARVAWTGWRAPGSRPGPCSLGPWPKTCPNREQRANGVNVFFGKAVIGGWPIFWSIHGAFRKEVVRSWRSLKRLRPDAGVIVPTDI